MWHNKSWRTIINTAYSDKLWKKININIWNERVAFSKKSLFKVFKIYWKIDAKQFLEKINKSEKKTYVE